MCDLCDHTVMCVAFARMGNGKGGHDAKKISYSRLSIIQTIFFFNGWPAMFSV